MLARQSGSHRVYKNQEGKRVTVPYHTGILLGKEGQGILKAIWFRVPGCFNLAKASELDSGVLVFVNKVRGTIKELRLTAMDHKGEMLRWN